jgi:hypothetical protein
VWTFVACTSCSKWIFIYFVLCNNFLSFVLNYSFWMANFAARKWPECRILHHLSQGFRGAWSGPRTTCHRAPRKGHVSYCHHLASVVHRKLFQKSSPLKVLHQWKPNLVRIIVNNGNAKRGISPHLKIKPCDLDLWPWKSIGFQILLRSKYVPRLVKIHWRMLILKIKGQGHWVNFFPCNILVNTLESTSFNGFWPNVVHT